MTSEHPTPSPGPLALLRALNGRQLHREPRSLAHQLAAGQIDRAALIAARAHAESRAIETSLERGNRLLHEALTDEATPGVVDAGEARLLAAHLVTTATLAGRHTQTLTQL